MEYRKFLADRIFDGYRFIENKVLVLRADGFVEDLIDRADAGEGVEIRKGILTPGMVNCHCHLELSHMKGRIPEKTGLVDFVFKVITQRHDSEEEILEAIARAEEEMVQNGIVAVGDICNNTLTLSQKQKGRIRYYNFIEASGWLPAVSEARFQRARTIYDAFVHSQPFAPASIVPHAPYSVSEDLWQQIQPYFQGKVVSVHNQETRAEDEFFKQGTGDLERMYRLMQIDNRHHRPTRKSSLQSYFEKLSGAERVLLVHNTFTTREDIDAVSRPLAAPEDRSEKGKGSRLSAGAHSSGETFFCLCVNANLYIENTLPPVELFRSSVDTVVLGTDSLASNHSLSILDEIKTIRKHFSQIPLEEILKWATINGARALHMEHQLGSFEKGQKPGVVWMNEAGEKAKKLF